MEESIKVGIPFWALSGRNDKKAGKMSESPKRTGRIIETRKRNRAGGVKKKNIKNIGAELLKIIRINENKLCKINDKTPKNKRR